jgi:cytochrome b561
MNHTITDKICFQLHQNLVIIRLNTKNLPEVFVKNCGEKYLAKSVHFGLYVCLFLMPLSGYFMSSFYAGKNGFVSFFNLFKIPFFTEQNKDLLSFFSSSHEIISYIALILVGLHIAGSFKHLIFDKVNIFRKMIP